MRLEPKRQLRILDFDCEARPDAYLGGDLTTRSLTAIAACWADDPEGTMQVWALTAKGGSHRKQLRRMLESFRVMYDQADIVTGHNILRYDLPVISGSMVYAGLAPLGSTMASDTQLHGPKAALSYSRSMENMGDMFGLVDGKHHMNNTTWKRANTLDAEHVAVTIERVTSDVRMHVQLRAAMVEAGLLDPAMGSAWSPNS